jgi:hypothetical protein
MVVVCRVPVPSCAPFHGDRHSLGFSLGSAHSPYYDGQVGGRGRRCGRYVQVSVCPLVSNLETTDWPLTATD